MVTFNDQDGAEVALDELNSCYFDGNGDNDCLGLKCLFTPAVSFARCSAEVLLGGLISQCCPVVV